MLEAEAFELRQPMQIPMVAIVAIAAMAIKATMVVFVLL